MSRLRNILSTVLGEIILIVAVSPLEFLIWQSLSEHPIPQASFQVASVAPFVLLVMIGIGLLLIPALLGFYIIQVSRRFLKTGEMQIRPESVRKVLTNYVEMPASGLLLAWAIFGFISIGASLAVYCPNCSWTRESDIFIISVFMSGLVGALLFQDGMRYLRSFEPPTKKRKSFVKRRRAFA